MLKRLCYICSIRWSFYSYRSLSLRLLFSRGSRLRTAAIAVMLFPLILVSRGMAADEIVMGVESEVITSVPRSLVPDYILQRVEDSVQTTVSQALVGKSVSDVERSLSSVELTISNVVQRALLGFRVDEVQIRPDRITRVQLLLTPTKPLIESVSLTVSVTGLESQPAQLLASGADAARSNVSKHLIGVPVSSLDWAKELVESKIPGDVSTCFRDFTVVDVSVQYGQETVIAVTLKPIGPVINNLEVTAEAASIPRLLAVQLSRMSSSGLDFLRGLPVEFVRRNLQSVIEIATSDVASRAALGPFRVTPSVELSPDETARATIRYGLSGYFASIRAGVDAGNGRAFSPSIDLRVGRTLGDLGLYLGATARLPRQVSALLGMQFAVLDYIDLGYEIPMRSQAELSGGLVWMTTDIDDRLSVRLERDLSSSVNALSITYALTDAFDLSLCTGDGRAVWVYLGMNL